MALNALGGFRSFGSVSPRTGRFGVMPGRSGMRGRGFGDLIVAQQVQAPARRYMPAGPRMLGMDLPARGHSPRFTPPARFAGGRFGGPRRGLRLRGLGADEPFVSTPTPVAKYDPREFADFDHGPVRKKRKGKSRCAGRAVKCKMVPVKKGGSKKRRMCWDAKGMIAKTPKRKKRKK